MLSKWDLNREFFFLPFLKVSETFFSRQAGRRQRAKGNSISEVGSSKGTVSGSKVSLWEGKQALQLGET